MGAKSGVLGVESVAGKAASRLVGPLFGGVPGGIGGLGIFGGAPGRLGAGVWRLSARENCVVGVPSRLESRAPSGFAAGRDQEGRKKS